MAPKTATLLSLISHPDFKQSDKSLTPAPLTKKLAGIAAQILEDEIEQSKIKPMARRLYDIVKREAKSNPSWETFKDKCRQELASSIYTSQVISWIF